MQASLSTRYATRSCTANTPWTHTWAHMPQPMHFSSSSCRVTTSFTYRSDRVSSSEHRDRPDDSADNDCQDNHGERDSHLFFHSREGGKRRAAREVQREISGDCGGYEQEGDEVG